jgi:hypothetical protein
MTVTWHNHSGDLTCRPARFERPDSLAALVRIVEDAERAGTRVRMIGTGHSWSDVTFTDGVMVLPDRLTGLLEIDRDANRVRVLAGTRVRDLNAALDREGLALPNMGGYDGQRIAGVVATSTHGSGLGWGPFPDLVHSLDMVVSGGAVVRVEPAAGMTDPARFDGGELIQDDDVFRAAICGMGCLGLIHSLVIEVREKFWLNEVRTLDTWERVKGELRRDGVLGEGDHYELFLNPYARKDGTHRVLVTRRTDCPEPAGVPQGKLERHPLTELASSLPLTGVFLRLAARWFPRLFRMKFDAVLEGMVDDGYADVSYRVLNIGAANALPAYSMELGIPLSYDRHIAAVDRILAIAAAEKTLHTSPISLRFVAASHAYASMMHDEDPMMIELIMVLGSRHGRALLAGYERALADLGVRAHWGQYNLLTPERVRAAYPRWDDWVAVQRRFNATGVFNSPFTDRIGISVV